MKLMTEITAGKNGGSSFGFSDEGQLVHDAAAAHALKQVLDGAVGSILSQYARNLMVSRADELMRGWGFEPEAGK